MTHGNACYTDKALTFFVKHRVVSLTAGGHYDTHFFDPTTHANCRAAASFNNRLAIFKDPLSHVNHGTELVGVDLPLIESGTDYLLTFDGRGESLQAALFGWNASTETYEDLLGSVEVFDSTYEQGYFGLRIGMGSAARGMYVHDLVLRSHVQLAEGVRMEGDNSSEVTVTFDFERPVCFGPVTTGVDDPEARGTSQVSGQKRGLFEVILGENLNGPETVNFIYEIK